MIIALGLALEGSWEVLYFFCSLVVYVAETIVLNQNRDAISGGIVATTLNDDLLTLFAAPSMT